ncbi:hypothetical protein [Jannaschia sp. LMIT008]|uniref:hypothetical protein n=1 Tax=Jannaschia maritima TaxID=3032585 RepID=UPI0028114CA7|nr:hypothetical protein [Jannaschia sp. LMIT008]
MIRFAITLAAAATLVATTGCTTRQVVENTGDAALGVTKIAVRGAAGAVRLAGRGTVAGVRRLTEARGDLAAGTEVCFDGDGEVIGVVQVIDGDRTCVLLNNA